MGGHVFLDLREPVLSGWAMIEELNFADGPVIEPQPIIPIRRYSRHATIKRFADAPRDQHWARW